MVPVSWQTEVGEVYGGELDVTNGVLTVSHKIIDLGEQSYTYISARSMFSFSPPDAVKDVAGAKPSMACEVSKAVSLTDMLNNQSLDNVCSVGTTGTYIGKIVIRNLNYTDGSAFATAMNGYKLVYELATPLAPIQLTPTQITTLLGTNNIWADTGDIDEVIYIRDLNLAFNSGTRSLSLSKGATEEEEKKEEPTEEEPKEEKR